MLIKRSLENCQLHTDQKAVCIHWGGSTDCVTDKIATRESLIKMIPDRLGVIHEDGCLLLSGS